MKRQPKLKKLFLDFCNKNGLQVEDKGGGLCAYIPKHYFTDNPEDVPTFIEYSDYSDYSDRGSHPCISFETGIQCIYDAIDAVVMIDYDSNPKNIYTAKDFKLVEITYKNIMSKLEIFNVLIKEMKINERKKSLEQDFQDKTK